MFAKEGLGILLRSKDTPEVVLTRSKDTPEVALT